MQDLVPLRVYELVANHPPPPIEQLLLKLSSEHARRTYRRVIDHYLAWLWRDPFEAAPVIVSNYKGELLLTHRPSVVALHLRIVRELYQEALHLGLLRTNPAANIAPPDFTPDPSCIPPSPEIAAAHLESCNRRREAGRRDHALCLLAIETEIEPAEVPGLTVQDYHCEDGRGLIRLRTDPGYAPVEIGLSDGLKQALDEYLENREVADDSPLFGPPRLRSHVPGVHQTSPAQSAGSRSMDRGLVGWHPHQAPERLPRRR